MAIDKTNQPNELSRRAFLASTGGALAGAASFGLAGNAHAGEPKPGRGGTVRFGTRSDALGLDPHRNNMYYVSYPLALTTQGLLDLTPSLEPTPGIATEWSASPDLMTYTFKLRQGVLFHNGREVDAAAVKWNYERIKNPKVGNGFARSALANVKEIVAPDKYTVRLHLHQPSAVLPANVTFYPCNLMAPDSEAQADEHPIGCGPFKFVKWERYAVTRLERFENYFETDAEGNNLPYLEAIEGRPKQADRVRLTALRSGEVDLIDNMAYSDAAEFPTTYAGQFQTWDAPSLGTAHLTFNCDSGPFSNNTPEGKMLRQAVAHATDHEAIHQAVFYKRGDIATSFYAKHSPWYSEGVRPWPEYDPEKAKFLLKKAKAVGIQVDMMANKSWPYMQQTGELLQAMMTEVGFKASFNIYDAVIIRQKRRSGEFHLESEAAAYRFDPDGWFSREIHSNGPTTKQQSRFRNDKADKLIDEARRTRDKNKRLELYAAVDSIVNEELPQLYTHHLTLLEAAVMNLQNYRPAISGSAHTKGAGLRAAWMA
ncbi:ABC transporter substrate-binding protein [Candidatus Entotheonella palauensis]|uniref:ABC transporter substrate-binding protein n=1 Tax=Candidatus Entotheonella palauensis TaxID=93172 RepID=UPI000B7F1ACA|nr:ABC transporter substrate-binding protein [Candidatus Entotheonella palauensis]